MKHEVAGTATTFRTWPGLELRTVVHWTFPASQARQWSEARPCPQPYDAAVLAAGYSVCDAVKQYNESCITPTIVPVRRLALY